MAIKMVREPSETPNINNIDDIIGLRYAYGNQDGYVIDRGNEISYTISGSNFIINSGRIVLQGVESDIDANGVTIPVDNIASFKYYTIYCEVNLGINSSKIKSVSDNETYPVIDKGNDLTENSKVIARLALYHFTAQNGLISNVEKIVKPIEYIDKNFIKNTEVENAKNVNNLEIKRDDNGVLKIGDVIIPQKKLIWEGSKFIPVGYQNWTNILDNASYSKTYEVEILYKGTSLNTYKTFGHSTISLKFKGDYNVTLSTKFQSSESFGGKAAVANRGAFRIENDTLKASFYVEYLQQFSDKSLGVGWNDNKLEFYVELKKIYEIIE